MKSILNNNNRGVGKKKHKNLKLERRLLVKSVTTVLNINENEIRIMRVDNEDYICLTDLARYKNPDNPGDVIIKWMSNKSSFDYYSLWEELFNEEFKLAESREFKKSSSEQSFKMECHRIKDLKN